MSTPHVLPGWLIGTPRYVGLFLLAVVAMLPTAALWGVRHAHVDDYLGPHRTTYQVTYSGEIALDLGPLGHAYLDDRFVPKSLQFVGLDIKIEGVRGTQGASTDILSASTLEAYLQVYAEPRGVLHGPLEKLVTSAIIQTAIAEGVLLVVCALWLLRRRWLSPGLARALRPRWVVSGYLILVLIILGSVLPAEPPGDDRISVSITDNTPFAGMQVDNRLLAVLLNRGISGLRVLADRQQAAIDAYVQTAEASFTEQLGKVAPAATNETMTLGYSDLHCSLAMTAVIAKVVTQVQPALLISSGDDTMNGTAAERPCLVRERAMAGVTGLRSSPPATTTPRPPTRRCARSASPCSTARWCRPAVQDSWVTTIPSTTCRSASRARWNARRRSRSWGSGRGTWPARLAEWTCCWSTSPGPPR